MKILIMGFTKMKYMPYMNFYLDQMDLNKDEIHVLFWNRDGKPESAPNDRVILQEFFCIQEDDMQKWKKIGSLIKYRKNALELLKTEQFDFVFVLHSIPGVLVSDYLVAHYCGKFVFDYRDYTYEGLLPFKFRVGKLAKASYATFVSSDAFRVALPRIDKIYTSHNLLEDSLAHRLSPKKEDHNAIRLSFWGFIRHEKINREIIRKISAEPRFELHFYGREQDIALSLKQYAHELSASNVFFHGEYKPDDRYEFCEKTDLIHNIYSNEEQPHTKFAMGNKYYDGLIFHLPQICMPGSFMGEMVERAHVGIVCDPFRDDFTDVLWNYYHCLDASFSQVCDNELKRVLQEYWNGVRIIKNALISSR